MIVPEDATGNPERIEQLVPLLAHLILKRIQEGPLLLSCENLHAAGSIALSILHNLSDQFKDEPLWFVATSRTEMDGFDRTIDVHILKLRRKLEPDPRHPRYIKTVYGAGYKILELDSDT